MLKKRSSSQVAGHFLIPIEGLKGSAAERFVGPQPQAKEMCHTITISSTSLSCKPWWLGTITISLDLIPSRQFLLEYVVICMQTKRSSESRKTSKHTFSVWSFWFGTKINVQLRSLGLFCLLPQKNAESGRVAIFYVKNVKKTIGNSQMFPHIFPDVWLYLDPNCCV